MIINREIQVLDLDFDDIEEVYNDAEADCVGEFGDELPLANEHEEALYKFWRQWDERHQDLLDHAKQLGE
jgi:hypothetical protein